MDNKLINEIISLAENGGARGNDITAVYSRVYIALKKSLGITPYAEQIGAAGAHRAQHGADADRRGQDIFRSFRRML